MSKFKPAAWPRQLRSQHWYGGTSRDTIYHRGWMKNQGHPHDLFDGRPVIGILNTWSDLTPCNGHLRELAEKVKAGVWEAGGFPVEIPVFSASENTFRPTAMMYRNLAALAVAGAHEQGEHAAAEGVGSGDHVGDDIADPQRLAKIMARIPMEKFGQPEDIGWAMAYLLSPAAGYVTGQVLAVDGGAQSGF